MKRFALSALACACLALGGCAATEPEPAAPAGDVVGSDLPSSGKTSTFKPNPSLPLKYSLKKGSKGAGAAK